MHFADDEPRIGARAAKHSRHYAPRDIPRDAPRRSSTRHTIPTTHDDARRVYFLSSMMASPTISRQHSRAFARCRCSRERFPRFYIQSAHSSPAGAMTLLAIQRQDGRAATCFAPMRHAAMREESCILFVASSCSYLRAFDCCHAYTRAM